MLLIFWSISMRLSPSGAASRPGVHRQPQIRHNSMLSRSVSKSTTYKSIVVSMLDMLCQHWHDNGSLFTRHTPPPRHTLAVRQILRLGEPYVAENFHVQQSVDRYLAPMGHLTNVLVWCWPSVADDGPIICIRLMHRLRYVTLQIDVFCETQWRHRKPFWMETWWK